MAPRPRIRVAVAQLAYHPAARIDGRRSPREDPLFAAGAPPSLRPPGVDLPPPIDARLHGLERRIAAVHDHQLMLRLRAIVASCRRWRVDLLVLPEYSAPAGLLRGLAEAAGEVMVVAGSHVVDRESLRVCADLGWRGDAAATLGCAVAPVLHRGRIVHLQAKLHSGDPASERPGTRWEPAALPGGAGAFGVVFADDVERKGSASPTWHPTIGPALARCDLVAVLAYAPLFTDSFGRIASMAHHLAPVAAVAKNSTDADAQFVTATGDLSGDRLGWPEEALLLADLDLEAGGGSHVASPSLVYRAHPVGDEYAAWSTAFAAHLEDATADDLGELIATCAETRNLLLGAGALMEGDSRDRRLRRLVDDASPPADLDELRALTREVVLPRACVPFDHLCVALARAALGELRGWLREAQGVPTGADALLACVEHLERRLAATPAALRRAIEVPTPDLWSDAGREALAEVAAALRGPAAQATARPRARKTAIGGDAQAPRALGEPAAPGFPRPSDAELAAWLADYRGLAEVWSERRTALLRDTDALFEPPLALTPGAEDPRPALGLLDAWADGDAPLGLLLGSGGIGKSTLLVEWAARRWQHGRAPLPIVVRLDWSRGGDDPLAALLELAALADTPTARARLRHLLARGALLPCFDGFDEALARLSEEAHAHLLASLLELLTLAEGSARLLIASRSELFDAGAPAAARVDAALGERGPAARIQLQPFSDAQVAALIRKLAGDAGDGAALLDRLTSHYELEHLARRPLLVAMVLRTLGSLDPTTRVTAADIYEAYFERWQADAAALAQQPFDAAERALLLESLALTLWDRAASACAAAELRRGFLRDLAPALAQRDDAALARDLARGLPAGFVVGDPDGGLRFTHSSFVEFFVARALVRHLGRCRERLLGIRALSPAIVDFVDWLLHRRGGDTLAEHWQRALAEWVDSRARVERTASAWLGNARRVLDALASRRGDALMADTGAIEDMAGRSGSLEASADDDMAYRAGSKAPGAGGPRRELARGWAPAAPTEAAPTRGAIDRASDARELWADTDDDEADAFAGDPAQSEAAGGDEAPAFEAEAAQEELEIATPAAPPQAARGDLPVAPARRPAPSLPQRDRGPPEPQRAATPALVGREPSAKKRLLLSKAGLSARAAPADREPNRFRPGGPLADPDLPGREDILREFSTLLDQPSPALLKGPRRAGKSSILRAIQRREGPRREVVRCDLERGGLLRGPDELARLLFPDLRGEADPAESLWRRLDAARAAGEPPPALLLDELAYLREGDDALFAWLRALGQEGLAGLILAGSHADWIDVIRRANRTPGSSFGNDYTVVELGPLSEAEAIRFLVVTAPDDVAIDPTRTAKWIVDLCGGWPFYLQVMGYAVVEEVRSGRHAALVRPEALRDLYERRLLRERGPAVFGSRWGDLRRPAQELLLAELERARERGTRHLTPYKELPRQARAILSNADLIDAVSGWKIDRPFADWLHRNLDELELSHG
ncbi:MAG: hypothetical protein R3A79_12080 [Nannocystaceae bacterium]